MSVMVKEIFEAFVEAGASEEKAKAAAGVVPIIGNLATKTDLVELQMATKEDMSKMELRLVMWMVSLQLTSLVLLATFIKFL